jgi:hypothetical protein
VKACLDGNGKGKMKFDVTVVHISEQELKPFYDFVAPEKFDQIESGFTVTLS